MRVLFLEIDTEGEWAVASIGPAFLGAYLRANGHEADLLRVALDDTPAEILEDVRERGADIIGLSLTTRQWLRGRQVVADLRRDLDLPVVAGGLHPTFSPEEVLGCDGFDFVCLGEGEAALLDLVNALAEGAPDRQIANIWRRGGTRPILRNPIEPLDSLPHLARDLLDEPTGVIHMTTQRGCPFPCTYCAARMYNQLYASTAEYGRRRTHQSVLDELFSLQDQLHYVIFLDDTFTINHGWVKEFCRVYGEELRVPFSLHARVETVNPKLIEMLAAAGCHQITYGVESGSPRFRREVLRRHATNERFADVFRWTRDAGIIVTANYMLGMPDETPDDVEQTLALAEALPVTDFGYFVFYPYPGTQLFKVCRERGYLPDDYLERPANHRETILELPTLSQAQIANYYDLFTELRGDLALERGGYASGSADHVHRRAERG
ncbi:MAG: anaerobic magnesium-protoporphyrin IX monomethyl ester cyclase [Myxococcota bacterium]|jgi:anaerobic magnesium-protoporphyrin IX monomethyl ester cyclase